MSEPLVSVANLKMYFPVYAGIFRRQVGTVPSVVGPRERRLRTIEGQPPVLTSDPDFCPFAPRCGHAFDRCRREDPPRIPVGGGHDVACWWDPATGGPRHV